MQPSAKPQLVALVFESGRDARDEFEAEERGYRSHVWVELDDGTRHQVTFFDPIRLSQELEEDFRSGKVYFTEPGLIILPAVTTSNMEVAIQELVDEGFFSASPREGKPG
jgi:hypothetical protein